MPLFPWGRADVPPAPVVPDAPAVPVVPALPVVPAPPDVHAPPDVPAPPVPVPELRLEPQPALPAAMPHASMSTADRAMA